jgi:hypothetical protein
MVVPVMEQTMEAAMEVAMVEAMVVPATEDILQDMRTRSKSKASTCPGQECSSSFSASLVRSQRNGKLMMSNQLRASR